MKRFLLGTAFLLTALVSFAQVEICNNGVDDDFDGFIDCYDGSCATSPLCDGIFLGNDATCEATPPVFPQFTMSLDFSSPDETTNHLSRMSIGDLDRDGIPEIVTMNRYTKKLFILSGKDGSIKHQTTVTWEPYWEVAIANLDDDSCGEIFFIGYQNLSPGTANDGVYMFSYDCQLNLLWTSKKLRDDPINYGIADFDGDGQEEIYAKDEIYDAKTGTRIVKSTAPNYARINGGPVAANVTGDTKLELILGLNIYQVNLGTRAEDVGSLTFLKGRTEYYVRNEYNATSVADFNEDGSLDVIASGSTTGNGNNTTVFFWDVQNDTIKTYSDPQPGLGNNYKNGWINGTGRINVADLDGINGMNASFVSGRFLYALDENWNLLWKTTINEETSGHTGCTLFDFNGDGKSEVVYRDEQYLYIIDGTDGTPYPNPPSCISRTNREYPIVADVDGDGSTELCVTCGYNDAAAWANFGTLSYSRYSHVRVYKSAAEPWVPARRVWNQHGYFVVNVNDDLSIPTLLQQHHAIFSTGNCTQGPNRPLNKFLNQAPYLNSEGCPTYASADIAFNVTPTIVPPTCPEVNFQVSFKLTNLGDVSVTGAIPVSFYTTNPLKANAVKLGTISVAVTDLKKGDIVSVDNATVPGIGSDSVYVVLNDAGTSIPTPIVFPNTPFYECDYDNVYGAKINPIPAAISALKVADNDLCGGLNNAAVRAFVPTGATENTTDYNFYWSNGAVAKPVASADFVGAIYSGIPAGTYTVYAIHKTAGCNSDTTQVVVGSTTTNIPAFTINVLSDQTSCAPLNGKLEVVIPGGGAGYTVEWYDLALNPLGITGPVANNLLAGRYVAVVTSGPCSAQGTADVGGPSIADPQANVLQHVVDCSNPTSGTINADAIITGVPQNPSNYTFTWYEYNNLTSTQGSILDASHGTGPTRTALPVGHYQVELKDNASQCVSTIKPIVQITSQTVMPDAPQIVILSSQTSCDPANPNGVMTANVFIGGVAQNPSNFTFEWFKGQNTLPANLVATVSDVNGKTVNQVAGGGIPYTVKVTTANNCSVTANLPVTENIINPVVTLAQLSPNSICDPSKASSAYNGSLQATVTFNGNPVTLPNNNYTFTWRNPANAIIAVGDNKNPILSGLQDGNAYSVSVTRTDISCPSNVDSEPVTKATILPQLSAVSTGSNNCNAALTPDGTVTVSITNTGASPGPFTYQWYDGNAVGVNPLGAANNGTTATVIKVGGPTGAPRPYTVEVLNTATGCVNNTTQFVADNSVVPVLSTTTTPNSICSPLTSFNGSMTVSVNNIPVLYTIADYTFVWYDGNNTTTQHNPQPTPVTSTTLSTLDAGTYSVIGTNTKTGCVSALATDQVGNTKLFPSLVPSSKGSNNCINDPGNGINPDGTASVAVTVAAGPFSYQWYVGSGDPIAGVFPVVPLTNNGQSQTATGLGGPVGAPISYTVLVTDQITGCRNYVTTTVTDNSVIPVLSSTTVANSICTNGSFAGSMSVNVTNIPAGYALSDYTFQWYDGTTTTTLHTPQPALASATTLPGLDAGSYSAVGRNTKTGCISAIATNTVGNTKLIPSLATSSVGSHNCINDPGNGINPDGTASVTVTVAAGPFDFQWYVGSGNPITSGLTPIPAAQGGNTSSANGLGGPVAAPNAYTVLVTDQNTGCSNYAGAMVADISQKPTFTLTPTANTVCDINLPGGPTQYNGFVTISAVTHPQLGTSTITNTWYNADPVTGAIVGGPRAETGTALNNLDGGKYVATVTVDDLGCTSDPLVREVLDDLDPPVIVPFTQANINCVNPNGIARVTSVDGFAVASTSNYTYTWYNGLTVSGAVIDTDDVRGTNIAGPSTSFTVEVMNKTTGCIASAPVTVVDAIVTPTVTATLVKNNTICDIPTLDPDGELTATAGNVGPNITFSWSGAAAPAAITGADNQNYTKLAPGGPYTVFVTDDNTGCQSATDSKSITNNLTFPAIAISKEDQTACAAPMNGELTATAAGTVVYTWYNGIGTGGTTHAQTAANSGIINQLASGDYTVHVRISATGCEGTETRFVPNAITNPVVTLTNSQLVTTCGVTPNGQATATITGLSGMPTFASTQYDIFYAYTKAGGVAPTTAAAVISAADPQNLSNQSVNPPPAYTGLAPGYLTAYVVDKNTLCSAVVNTAPILDNLETYDINIDAVQQAGLCGAGGGGISVTVERSDNPGVNCATCTFAWYRGTPSNSNINFFDNLPNMTSAVLLGSPPRVNEDLGAPAFGAGVGAGTYTLVVLDSDPAHVNCGNYKTDFVPPSSLPNVTPAITHVTDCVTPNGQYSVNVNGASVAGYTLRIFRGTDATGTLITQLAVPANPAILATAPTLSKGEYFLEILDNDGVNVGCPFGEIFEIDQLVAPPILSITSTVANTSCDPSVIADGSVTIKVDNDPSDTQGKVYRVTTANPVVAGYATPNIVGAAGMSGQSETISGLKPIAYTFTVTDQNSNCATDVNTTIPDSQGVPGVLSVLPTAETLCANGSNGSALASISGTPITDFDLFDFTWAQNNDLSGAVYASAGSNGFGNLGELLNRAHATASTPGNFWPMGTAGNGSGNRIFYVQAVKNNSAPAGVGCKTGIVQVVIPDQHITPDITLSPTFDSFCLATAANGQLGDGQIIIAADANPSVAGQQNAVGGFNYLWTNPNSGSGGMTTPQNGVSNNFTIPQLGDGSYQITATNVENGCTTVKTVSVPVAPYIININSTEPITHQRICNNDGLIRVSSITLTDNSVGSPNSQTTTNAAIDPLYNFEWYNNAALTGGTQLRDGGGAGALISERTLSNDVNQDQTVNQAGDFHGMQAGTYYAVATRTDNTQIGFGCTSLPFQVVVNDVHVNPAATLVPLSNTSCLAAAPEGEIIVNISDATAAPFAGGTYAYTWAVANPTAIGNTAVNDGDGSNADGDGDHPTSLLEGAYNVTVVNNRTGCSVLGTTTIIKNATPVFVTAATTADQFLCNPDGSITIGTVTLNDRAGAQQVFDGASTPNISDFDFEWQRVGIAGSQTTVGPVGATTLNTANYNAALFAGNPAFGAGTYTVIAKRRTGAPGAGCPSAPFTVVIQDKRISPVVTLTPFANTSCSNVIADFEGEIEVRVTDANAASVNPDLFTYNWTTSATPTVINGLQAGSSDGDASSADGDDDNPTGLREGNYAITVTNTQTNCAATATTTIFKNSTPVITQLVTPTDQVLCTADGRLVVNEVKIIDRDGNTRSSLTDFAVTDFDFTYSRTTMANVIPGVTGTQLDNTNYPAIGADTYFVVATRVNNGPGFGCSSPAYQVTIQNKQILPIVSLRPYANTSCDPLAFEGEIEVRVTDNSVNLPAPFVAPYTFNYTYNWTASATPAVINGPVAGVHDGDKLGGGDADGAGLDNDGDHPRLLQQGNYTLAVTNNQTGCASSGTTTIFKNSTPVFTQLVLSTPQVVCNPDGTLTIQEVKVIDRDGNIQSNLTGDFNLTDFAFSYDRGTIGNNIVANSHPSQPVVQLNTTTYPAIGIDAYYVVATRIAGGPGLNCASAPYKIDILDQRLFPKVDFTSTPSSSCDETNLPNGLVTANASEQNGTNTGPYAFTWTLNGLALTAPSTQTDNNASSVIDNARSGDYVVTTTNTVTGCPMNVPFTLQLDETLSTPNIIDVTTVDPLDCNPSGSATVTKITLGSTSHSVLFPPNIPPNNEITGVGLNSFNYEWYEGSVAPGNQLPIGGPPFTTAPAIASLVAGTYFVIVHDPTTDCRSNMKEVVISDDDIIYPVLDITQTAKQVSCIAGVGSASLAARADGQDDTNANYVFSWFSNGTNTPPVFANTSTISSIAAGTYSVTVVDQTTSCAASDSYVIMDATQDFMPFVSTGSQPRTMCVGTDGTVVARVLQYPAGYPHPYNATTFTADLFFGATPNLSGPPDMPAIPSSGVIGNFEQIAMNEGVYTVRITDNNTGCVGVATETVRDSRQYPLLSITEISPVTNCDPARPNGVAQATANGTFVGYQFDWYEGSSVSGSPVYTGPEYSALKVTPQQYTVRATNLVSGCTSDRSATVSNGTKPVPAATIEVLSNVTSCVISNGILTAFVGADKNTSNYIFHWYDGTVESPPADEIGVVYSGLAEGKYSVTATSIITGCKSPLTTGEIILEREFPDFDFIIQNTTCDQSDGFASLVMMTDVQVESIEWSVPGQLPFLIGPNFADAGAGVYEVTVTSALGCPTTKTVEIKNEIRPYNGISRNNDDQNQFFQIDCIQYFENNIVKIFNRAGTLVYEAKGYDNGNIVFDGTSNKGISPMGTNLPDGTYYFIVDKRDGSKPVAGYLEIVK